eukprot:IDg17839t1
MRSSANSAPVASCSALADKRAAASLRPALTPFVTVSAFRQLEHCHISRATHATFRRGSSRCATFRFALEDTG